MYSAYRANIPATQEHILLKTFTTRRLHGSEDIRIRQVCFYEDKFSIVKSTGRIASRIVLLKRKFKRYGIIEIR